MFSDGIVKLYFGPGIVVEISSVLGDCSVIPLHFRLISVQFGAPSRVRESEFCNPEDGTRCEGIFGLVCCCPLEGTKTIADNV